MNLLKFGVDKLVFNILFGGNDITIIHYFY